MPFCPCGRNLVPGDGHDCCLSCLGIKHTEVAFVDESCSHCGGMTVAELRTRIRFLQRGGVPVPLPRSRVPLGGRQGGTTSGSSWDGLRVTVRNSSRALPATGTSLPAELLREQAGPIWGVPLVSFWAPPDDWMSIAASEGQSDHSGNDDSCRCHPMRVGSTLLLHVTTHTPPPPLESEASEVASRHSHSGLAQPGSRRAVTSLAPRRVETPSPDGPADLETDRPVRVPRDFSLPVVLLPDQGNTRHGCAGTSLCKYAFPPVSLLAQTLCKIREDEEQILLVVPYWPTRTWFPELMLLVTAPPWQIPLRKDLLTQRQGILWHPHPDLWMRRF